MMVVDEATSRVTTISNKFIKVIPIPYSCKIIVKIFSQIINATSVFFKN